MPENQEKIDSEFVDVQNWINNNNELLNIMFDKQSYVFMLLIFQFNSWI